MSASVHPGLVAVVALGGAVGTAGRYGVTLVLADGGHAAPPATLLVNLVGSLLLGMLLEALVRRGEGPAQGRFVRLGLGTGVLGGFTTYSSLAVELERMLAAGDVLTATGWAAANVVGGLLACGLGVVLGARAGRSPRP